MGWRVRVKVSRFIAVRGVHLRCRRRPTARGVGLLWMISRLCRVMGEVRERGSLGSVIGGRDVFSVAHLHALVVRLVLYQLGQVWGGWVAS